MTKVSKSIGNKRIILVVDGKDAVMDPVAVLLLLLVVVMALILALPWFAAADAVVLVEAGAPSLDLVLSLAARFDFGMRR